MATFGKYETVTELHASDRGAVYSARVSGGGREIKYAIKVFNPRALDLDEQFWETQAFLERARVQQRVADAGHGHWAAIHEVGTSPAGPYYVTDFHPLSAASLVAGKVDVSPGVLYAIIRSVVSGLSDLKSVAGRAHGNLKATNVLVSSRGNVAVAGAVLTDPAAPAEAAKTGESGDLRAVGELIYLLVTGRPFPGPAAWPAPASRDWLRLGRRPGLQWRRLCNDLLSPDPTARLANLEAVTKRLRRLVPKRPRPSRRMSIAAVVLLLLLAGGAAAVLGVRDAGARREICAAERKWAGPLTAALADPDRRLLFESDPDLRRVVAELDRADLDSFDCDGADAAISFHIRQYQQTQERLAALRRAERGLSPIQWRQLARAADFQGRFEGRGWTQPALHLEDRIAAARPGSDDVAGGVERFLRALEAVDRDLEAVEAQWRLLQGNTRGLDVTRDPILTAFAEFLRQQGARTLRLTDTGFTGVDMMKVAAARAEELAAARARIAPRVYDEDRFVEDVRQKIKPQERPVGDDDIAVWLETLENYAVQRDKIDEAVAKLRQDAETVIREVEESKPDPKKELPAFRDLQRAVLGHIESFQRQPFIKQDFLDGEFDREREQIASQINSLGSSFLNHQYLDDWLESIAHPLRSSSDELNEHWDKHVKAVLARKDVLSRDPNAFVQARDRTALLQKVLPRLDKEFPRPPHKLTLRGMAQFRQAATRKREQALRHLLGKHDPTTLTSDFEPVKSAAAAYRAWAENLFELTSDFPLRAEILGVEERPDVKWRNKNPAFWEDPIVRELVAPHVARIDRLQVVEHMPRAELLEYASQSEVPEVALHAWRLLGAPKTTPPWPTAPGELKAEADLRARIQDLVWAQVNSEAEREKVFNEMRAQGPVRWSRFAEAAGASEEMLAAAADLRETLGATEAHFNALNPAVRFNLSLLATRRLMADDADDAALRPVVATLETAAADLKAGQVPQQLISRLQRVHEKEPFAAQQLGDTFELRPFNSVQPIAMRRVKAPGLRPFYLGTTEISVAQFAAVLDAAGKWDAVRSLVWSPQPGQTMDPRKGPRAWEWVSRPARVWPPELWLAPPGDNLFPPAFRKGRFNRTVLSDAVGGNPSEAHPMQYVPAEAAMYFAALCDCRLPTPGEWAAAYEQFEKTVPAAQWNLRDATWETFRNFATSAEAEGVGQRPDEGIFLPPKPIVARGAAARGHAHDDGTLFFRAVDARPGGDTFRHLVGNVAEFVHDDAEAFEAARDRNTPDGAKRFAAEKPDGLMVVGGSALSPIELPFAEPLPARPGGTGFADVGFRLAFTAPSRSIAARLEWVLAGQGYVKAEGPPQETTAAANAGITKPETSQIDESMTNDRMTHGG